MFPVQKIPFLCPKWKWNSSKWPISFLSKCLTVLTLVQSWLSLQALIPRNDTCFNIELSFGIANVSVFVFLAASLKAHHAQPAHCSCSALYSFCSHKGSWAGYCDHGKQHTTGSNNSCGNNQWATGLFFCFSVPSHCVVGSVLMLVQLRWVLAAGGKVERGGFPIQWPLVVGSVLLGERQTQLSLAL